MTVLPVHIARLLRLKKTLQGCQINSSYIGFSNANIVSYSVDLLSEKLHLRRFYVPS